MILGKQNLYGSPVNFSKTPIKIVPVNDVNSVCRVCVVGLCPGAADPPCKYEKIVNVKHNLLIKPSKEDTRGKLSFLLRSEVRPSTELSHNICYKCKRDIDRITKSFNRRTAVIQGTSRLLSGHYTFIERSGAMFRQLSWLKALIQKP